MDPLLSGKGKKTKLIQHWNRLLLVFGVSILGDIQNVANMALGILFIDPTLNVFSDYTISRGIFQHQQFWENWDWAQPSSFTQAKKSLSFSQEKSSPYYHRPFLSQSLLHKTAEKGETFLKLKGFVYFYATGNFRGKQRLGGRKRFWIIT